MSYKHIIILLLIAIVTLPAIAQSEPTRLDLQNAVLADMSTRTGTTVTMQSLSAQLFFFGTYEYVTGLGCPLAPASAPTTGNWHRFEYTYNGEQYNYIVSDNLVSLILCNANELGTPIAPTARPTLAPTQTPLVGTGQQGGGVASSATSVSQPTSVNATQSGSGTASTSQINTNICPLPTRMVLRGIGQVLLGEPNWLHALPSRQSPQTGEIPAGDTFRVIDGPICDESSGMVYWQVSYGDSFIGWTSEGLNNEYWIEPLFVSSDFLVENVGAIGIPQWASLVPADQNPLTYLNEDGTFLAVTTSETSLTVYDTTTLEVVATYDTFSANIQSVYISPNGSHLVVVTVDNLIQITSPINNVPTGITSPTTVTALIMPYGQSLLITATDEPALYFWDTANPATPLRTIQLPQAVTDMQFSSDNTELLLRNADDEFVASLSFPASQP
ncbi:MAG: hypothetical protein AAFR81_12265 [Chloroflexota bacterium]